MDYKYLVEKLKGISASRGEIEDARNDEYIVPDGYVLVHKDELDNLIGMAMDYCNSCNLPCKRDKREFILCCLSSEGLWNAYAKAIGMKEWT